ncbi:MAG: TROVE domain-containing protein [Verrucomicrobiales bacterium]|nr:TROVE domain-containing protein [Verrucomicrobiales bacterium]
MANLSLFRTLPPGTDVADTRNEAGGKAYAFSPRHALAQYAATGCLNGTFYADAATQLKRTLELASAVEPAFAAKVAIYSREKGFMKDMPALLCAALSVLDADRLQAAFPRACDDAKTVRNFVQILRSGAVGRKSLGTVCKRLVRRWLESRTEEQLFRASVGQSPSLADLVKMVHPCPATPTRAAFYGWLLGRPHDASLLPDCVKAFEAFKRGETRDVPDVPFQMLASFPIGKEGWTAIARRASWQMTRMNLNTFARHDVFADRKVTRLVAARLRDPALVRRSKVFPYQLMVAHSQADPAVPEEVREALQDAMDVALENIPTVEGRVVVCPDVSGSMVSPVTGTRKGSTTVVTCRDVAALIAAAILRKNADALVLPFSDDVVPVRLNRRDSVLTNARTLAALPSGGTNCSAPLRYLNETRTQADLVVFVSDNMSWVDADEGGRGTASMVEWATFRHRNPRARLACLDIQPNASTQAKEREDILNIGGFSDAVFDTLATFARGELHPDHWVGVIDSMAV